MIKLLPRTQSKTNSVREIYVQCDIGRYDDTGTGTTSCPFCRYRQEVTSFQTFITCRNKHACSGGTQPWIRFSIVKDTNVYDPTTGEPSETQYYNPTSVDRQAEFEGMPYRIRLCLAVGMEAKCNADCWWHGWRLANKRTWRQCGKTHMCGNNGSFWNNMAPVEEPLRTEFLSQM